MKRTLSYCLATAVLLCCFIPSLVTLGQDQRVPSGPGINQAAQPHPNITRAIHALEAARGDLQSAAHDYCGHRVEALEATNAALNQLGAAIACQERRGSSAENSTREGSSSGSGVYGGERHPFIRAAINALQSARRDLQNAAHEYCGHRAEALEATNGALNQLHLALRCDRD